MSKRNKAAERAARAAALRAQQEREERLRRTLTIGAVVLGIVVIIAGGFFIQSQRDSTGNDAAALDSAREALALFEEALRLGDPSDEDRLRIGERVGDVALLAGRADHAAAAWRTCLAPAAEEGAEGGGEGDAQSRHSRHSADLPSIESGEHYNGSAVPQTN